MAFRHRTVAIFKVQIHFASTVSEALQRDSEYKRRFGSTYPSDHASFPEGLVSTPHDPRNGDKQFVLPATREEEEHNQLLSHTDCAAEN